MSRLLLVHWNAAEARERAARLRKAGHRVSVHADSGAQPRALRENPPDAFVIDLDRIPSHGRALGVWLRQQRATREVPLVFVGGEPEKVERVRELLPDAEYASWSRIRSALRRALGRRVKQVAVPGTMAGYSGVPLARKLGITAGATVALLGAPSRFEIALEPLPEEVRIRKQARGHAEVVLLFSASRAALERRFPAAARAVRPGGRLWLAWPKASAEMSGDLTQHGVRRFGLDAGWVDYKICAIDATWSGLCFARRARPKRH